MRLESCDKDSGGPRQTHATDNYRSIGRSVLMTSSLAACSRDVTSLMDEGPEKAQRHKLDYCNSIYARVSALAERGRDGSETAWAAAEDDHC